MLKAPPLKNSEVDSSLVKGIVEEVNNSDFEGFDDESEPPTIPRGEVQVEIDLDARVPKIGEIMGADGDTFSILVDASYRSKVLKIGLQ